MDGKRQSLFMTGVGLIILSGIILYFSLSLPKMSSSDVPVINIPSDNSAAISSLQAEVFEDDEIISEPPINEPATVANTTFVNSKDKQTQIAAKDKPSESEVITIASSAAVNDLPVSDTANNTDAISPSQNDTNNAEPSESGAAYPININTCTFEELLEVDGIGEKRASAIIEYREYLGGYTSVEQIKDIQGIGERIYEKASPFLTV